MKFYKFLNWKVGVILLFFILCFEVFTKWNAVYVLHYYYMDAGFVEVVVAEKINKRVYKKYFEKLGAEDVLHVKGLGTAPPNWDEFWVFNCELEEPGCCDALDKSHFFEARKTMQARKIMMEVINKSKQDG